MIAPIRHFHIEYKDKYILIQNGRTDEYCSKLDLSNALRESLDSFAYCTLHYSIDANKQLGKAKGFLELLVARHNEPFLKRENARSN